MYSLFVIFVVLGGTISEKIVEQKSSKEDGTSVGNTKPALSQDNTQLDVNLEKLKAVPGPNISPSDNFTILPQAEAAAPGPNISPLDNITILPQAEAAAPSPNISPSDNITILPQAEAAAPSPNISPSDNITILPQAEAAAPDPNISPSDNITILPQAEAYIFHPQEGELLEAAARGAAQLVSAGLQMTPGGGPQEPQSLMARLISLLGLDPSKLAAVAVNGIIMMAQLISNTLTGFKLSEQTPPSGDPAAWIFENSPVEARELVKEATDTRLADRLIEAVRDSSSLATDCIELLLCKCTPMIGAMQTALSQSPPPAWSRLTPVRRMYSYFPRLETVARHSTACDVRFPACHLKYSHHDDL